MSNLRGASGLNRIDGESNESVCRKFGMSFKNEGMNCGVVERMGDEMTKRMESVLWV